MNKLIKSDSQNILFTLTLVLLFSVTANSQEVRKFTFDGTLCERKLSIKDLNPAMPSDWTGYTHLVMERRTTTPQRFSLWLYRTNETPVRIMFMPFGQNVWMRASVPLQYFKGRDQSGMDMASANNRRTNSFWFSTWGPFGDVKSVDAIGFAMPFPPLGRNDGENYNIGFVDINDRPYKELVEATKATHKRLIDVHSGKILPFSQRPNASDAGGPSLIRKY